MKAEELRIGNLYDQFGNITEVNWCTIKDLEKAPKEQLWCKPIPLTEEWLLKSGCEKKSDNIFTIDRFELRWKKAYKYWYVLDAITYNYFTKIEFVHEYQNFIFALTGQELELK
jgi:hypothetical protein